MDERQANNEVPNEAVLLELSLKVQRKLANIINPRHDRDHDVVVAEVRQICAVLVEVVEEIVDVQLGRQRNFNKTLDRNPQVGVDSATAPIAAAPEADNHAVHEDAQDSGDSTTAGSRKRRATKPQVPLP